MPSIASIVRHTPWWAFGCLAIIVALGIQAWTGNTRFLAIAEQIEPGMRLAFCTRNAEAAELDLVRIATEIRSELESSAARDVAGAVYVSCSGRGGPHFGARHAELQVVRNALGDVPLVGFFAGGEIARHHLYGYTGVLTVFTTPG